jgi:hypothetical protein
MLDDLMGLGVTTESVHLSQGPKVLWSSVTVPGIPMRSVNLKVSSVGTEVESETNWSGLVADDGEQDLWFEEDDGSLLVFWQVWECLVSEFRVLAHEEVSVVDELFKVDSSIVLVCDLSKLRSDLADVCDDFDSVWVDSIEELITEEVVFEPVVSHYFLD